MKNLFYGFYQPTEEEIKKTWKDSLIVFDANVLLNLYRYTSKTSDDFIQILHKISDRLWIPFQVGYEFHKNRISVIRSLEKDYNEIQKKFDEQFDKYTNILNEYKRHPFIKTEDILKEIKAYFEERKKALIEQRKSHPDYMKSDPILLEITNLFTGKVDNDLSHDELEKIYSQGENRYKNNIPPGYYDKESKQKKGNRNVYGDLIIWLSIITKIKKSFQQVMLITDDRKDDWWTKENGETIRPREELIKEFYDETGIRILIYQADDFLKYAKINLKHHVDDKSIKEVKEVRAFDEFRNQYHLIQDDLSKEMERYSKIRDSSYFKMNAPESDAFERFKNSLSIDPGFLEMLETQALSYKKLLESARANPLFLDSQSKVFFNRDTPKDITRLNMPDNSNKYHNNSGSSSDDSDEKKDTKDKS